MVSKAIGFCLAKSCSKAVVGTPLVGLAHLGLRTRKTSHCSALLPPLFNAATAHYGTSRFAFSNPHFLRTHCKLGITRKAIP